MSDIASPRSPGSPTRDGAQSKRRRIRDAVDLSPRYDSPDELAEDDDRNGSSRESRTSSRRDSRDDDLDEGSTDELDHTRSRYRRGDERDEEEEDDHDDGDDHDEEDTPEDLRSRSRTPLTPHDEDDDSSPAESPQPAKKPLQYKLKYSFLAHSRGVAQAQYSPDGSYIASVSADSTAKIWLASTGQLIHTLTGHLAGISALSWSPDSLTLATGSDDKQIRLWSLTTGSPIHSLTGHHNSILSLSFSPKGNILASGSFDEALMIWDVRSAHQLRSLPAHSDPIGAVDFTPDGTLVASCASDGLIRVWDTGSGQCLRTIVHEDNAKVAYVKFSPNGKYIAAWTVDSCVRLWDFVKGECKKTYQGHQNKKFSIGGAFGVWEEEAFLVSPSEDGRILFWDVKNKEILQDIKAHDDVVMCLHVEPSTGNIVSCDKSGYIKVWEPATEDEAPEGQINGVTNGMGNVKLVNGSREGSEGHISSDDEEMPDDEEMEDYDGHDSELIRAATQVHSQDGPASIRGASPKQGPPSNEQFGSQRTMFEGGNLRGGVGGETGVDMPNMKVEDLMQETVDEIMSDGTGAEMEAQIKSEMDSRM